MAQTPDPSNQRNTATSESAASGNQPRIRMMLQFEGVRKALIVDLIDYLVMGRSDEGENPGLGLDLSPYGAAQKGISRNHAALSNQSGVCFIEDLNSTNGTRINGFSLTPQQPYRLRDGDEVELGSARFVVRFAHSPR